MYNNVGFIAWGDRIVNNLSIAADCPGILLMVGKSPFLNYSEYNLFLNYLGPPIAKRPAYDFESSV